VSFVAITLCVASQRVFIVVYFVRHSVRKLLHISPYSILVGIQEDFCGKIILERILEKWDGKM